MRIADTLLPEFDQEMANTRKILKRVPDAHFAWKPHEKSMTMQGLTTHLANLPQWAVLTVAEDAFDMAPKDGPPPTTPPATTVEEALKAFDENVGQARAAIDGASDDVLLAPWKLLAGGEEVFALPRVVVLRSFVLSHSIHHRAQLGVYLRLKDVPVPALYGPTADES